MQQTNQNHVEYLKRMLASQGETVVKVLKTSLTAFSYAVVVDRPESSKHAGAFQEFTFESDDKNASYDLQGTILLSEDKFEKLTSIPEGSSLDLFEALKIEKSFSEEDWTAVAV